MSLALSQATILVLAPHTDDGELGAGASMARWAHEGNELHYLAFSSCSTVQPPDRDPEILRAECANSTATLGVVAENLRILDCQRPRQTARRWS